MTSQRSPEPAKDERGGDALLYTMYAVFRARTDDDRLGQATRAGAAIEVAELLEQAQAKGVYTRGVYDVAGFRADADLMFWWTAPSTDDLQEVYRRFRTSTVGRATEPVWSAIGLHRPAEFNPDHVPAFVRGVDPRGYLCVYPFVRSLEWYLLDPAERGAMLAEHGRMAQGYEDVLANTASAFGLGDYEWLLAFEADRPDRIVDLIRALRASAARAHTRVEVPFYTGARKPIAEIFTGLP